MEFRRTDLQEILRENGILVEHKSISELVDIVADIAYFGLAPQCQECEKSRLIWNNQQQSYECPTLNGWGQCHGSSFDFTNAKLDGFSLPTGFTIGKIRSWKPHERVVKPQPVSSLTSKRRYLTIDELKAQKKSRLQLSEDSKKSNEEQHQSRRLQFKGRSAVLPESELAHSHHIYEDGSTKTIYSACLAESNVETGRNSYYNIQLLEGDWVRSADKKKPKASGFGSASYYVFRNWGRVGTDIGDSRTERCDSLEEAIETFCAHFLHKTGNAFGETFVKKPFMFYPVDLAKPSEDVLDHSKSVVTPGSKTRLDKSVQNLLSMIFDMDAMRRVLLEMEIDVEKMPLGQLSKSQIREAYSVLGDLMALIQSGKGNEKRIAGGTNKFFTLIPHSFGMGTPPLLDNESIIKQKLQMLETMLEMEIATDLISHEEVDSESDPLDLHYKSLHAEIHPLDSKSEEFALISKYLQTTHAPTHTEYHLEIEQVFVVQRENELESYTKYLSEHPDLASNRKLLWHGSRVTNYVGILSKGLRIAPPEAPSTGYMFGKGVYFADMCTKSSNYCCTSPSDNLGLLVLSEVALGKTYDLTESEYLEKLPAGYNSTKGCGKTVPASEVPFPASVAIASVDSTPSKQRTRRSNRLKSLASSQTSTNPETISCPQGPPVAASKRIQADSDLLYNEYIVYDERQVNIRYIVQARFIYREKSRKQR